MAKKPTALVFTTAQYEHARFANGSRIVKQNSEAGDGTPDGMGGVVLGSLGAPDVGIGYFVEWDNRPGLPVVVIEHKVGFKLCHDNDHPRDLRRTRLALRGSDLAHTIVYLGACAVCGGLHGFPQTNLALALREGTAETFATLQAMGK